MSDSPLGAAAGGDDPGKTPVVHDSDVQAFGGKMSGLPLGAANVFGKLLGALWCVAAFAFIGGRFAEWLVYEDPRAPALAPLPMVVSILVLGIAGLCWQCAREGNVFSPLVPLATAVSFAPLLIANALLRLATRLQYPGPVMGVHGWESVLWQYHVGAPEKDHVGLVFQVVLGLGALLGMHAWLRWLAPESHRPAMRRWHRAALGLVVAGGLLLAWAAALNVTRFSSDHVESGIAALPTAWEHPIYLNDAKSDPTEYKLRRLSVDDDTRLNVSRIYWISYSMTRADQHHAPDVMPLEELGWDVAVHGGLHVRKTPDGRVWLLTEELDDDLMIAAAWRADDLEPIAVRLHHVTSAVAPSRLGMIPLALGLIVAGLALAARRRAARRLALIEGGAPGYVSRDGSIVLEGGAVLQGAPAGRESAVVVLGYSNKARPFRDHGRVDVGDVVLGERAELEERGRLRVAGWDSVAIGAMMLPLASFGTMALGWLL